MRLTVIGRLCVLVTLGALFRPAAATPTADRLDLRMSMGWVANPFFEDLAQQSQTPIEGPFGQLAAAGRIEWPLADRRAFRLRGWARLDRFTGRATTWGHTEQLTLDWRWLLGDVRVDLSTWARYTAIERFPTDRRWRVGVGPRAEWRVSPRVALYGRGRLGFQRFPERVDVDLDGTPQTDLRLGASAGAQLGPTRWGTTRWWLDVAVGAWQIDSNADLLDRDASDIVLQLIGDWRSLTWDASVGRWAIDLPEQSRSDTAVQLRTGVGVQVSAGWFIRGDLRRIVGDSDQAAGRFEQWRAGISFLHRIESVTSAPPSRAREGIEALGAGRFRFRLRAPDARQVALVGDFNRWKNEATPMRREADGWTVELTLPPGRQTFMFSVDGRLVVPPFGRRLPDDFGGEVGVLWVRP